MPRSRRYWRTDEMPGTLRRSCREAQETFTEALANAIQTYGQGDDAVRAAYAVLKRTFEKRGDAWIAKTRPADLARLRRPDQEGQRLDCRRLRRGAVTTDYTVSRAHLRRARANGSRCGQRVRTRAVGREERPR